MTGGRNDPCPCGSGKKYKKCCGAKRGTNGSGPKAAIRMKGGVAYDPISHAYRAIVHSWDNARGVGEPEEWQSTETFPSEDAAMSFYKANIRPQLEQLMAQASQESSGLEFLHRKLE